MIMLEAPLDVGRWLVQQALAAHWRQAEPADLPGEYLLYNDLCWQFAAPHLPDAYAHFFTTAPATGLDQPDMAALTNAADALVRHPSLRGWVGWAANVWSMLDSQQDDAGVERVHALIAYILRELDALPQRNQLLDHMATALRTQALWFALYSEGDNAGHALLLARWMRALPMRQNPLLAGLLQAGHKKER